MNFKIYKDILNTTKYKNLRSCIGEEIKKQQVQGNIICPNNANNVFKAFKMTQEPKVVIIGSEGPYFMLNAATGIAYGSTNNRIIPINTEIIASTIKKEYPETDLTRFDYTFESWRNQGVLMLHDSLTTILNKQGAHEDLWEDFMNNLISDISEKYNPVIAIIDRSSLKFKKHIHNFCTVIEEVSFFKKNSNVKIFKRINETLENTGQTSISWNIPF